jgi:hypothetical protein
MVYGMLTQIVGLGLYFWTMYAGSVLSAGKLRNAYGILAESLTGKRPDEKPGRTRWEGVHMDLSDGVGVCIEFGSRDTAQ